MTSMRRIVNQITNTLEELKKGINALRPKQKKFYQQFEFWIGLVSVILGIASIVQAIVISDQAQRIKDFDSLLRKQDTQIGNQQTLIKKQEGQIEQLSLLAAQSNSQLGATMSQLKISSQSQAQANANLQYL